MGAHAENQKAYPVDMMFFVNKVRQIETTNLRLGLKSENPMADGGVWFRILHGMSATSYGEKITVTLKPVQGGTNVHIHSECGMPTQLVDYGKNRKNVEAIFQYLEQGIENAPAPGAAQAPVQAVAPAPAPAVTPQPQPQPMPQVAPAPQPVPQPATKPQPQPTPMPAVTPRPQTQPVQKAAPARTHVFCTACGKQNVYGHNFCYACGAKLIKY